MVQADTQTRPKSTKSRPHVGSNMREVQQGFHKAILFEKAPGTGHALRANNYARLECWEEHAPTMHLRPDIWVCVVSLEAQAPELSRERSRRAGNHLAKRTRRT